MTRPSFDETFLAMAKDLSARSTCLRRHVGVIIAAPDNTIVGAGYNGAPRGKPHCLDAGCLVVDNHCTRVLHADSNALWFADKARLAGGTMYVYNGTPCYRCAQEIIRAGIVRVVCLTDSIYDEAGWNYLQAALQAELLKADTA